MNPLLEIAGGAVVIGLWAAVAVMVTDRMDPATPLSPPVHVAAAASAANAPPAVVRTSTP
jgi:hypothetical protein